MKNHFLNLSQLFRLRALLFFFTVGFQVYAQTTVNSLTALLPYLDDDNANVILSAGTYTVDASNISSFGNPVFLFEGSNSTYDFSNVTININTSVLQSFGNTEVNFIKILGNDNIIENLTLTAIGNTAPTKRATSVVMDGRGNKIEGLKLTVRGSYPYGYGDAFGKGSTNVINHKKHSAILVRGESNHLKDCDVTHRAYGHAIFTQAAENPLIEGCYVEGEVRTTDSMLAESGTGSPADNVNFMTVWGYTLPAGYMMSLQEEGIRAYNAGNTVIDGVAYSRGTSNITVRDCTVKFMRGGVTVAQASGTVLVDNVTALGCEQGFSGPSNSTFTNCKGNVKYGPIWGTAYSSDHDFDVDITILTSSNYYNGSKQVAYIGGYDHNMTFRTDITSPDQSFQFKISGSNSAVRNVSSNSTDLTSSNIEINNLTDFPLVLHSDSSGTSGTSCGDITDNGSNNNVGIDSDCDGVSDGVSNFPDPNATYYIENNRWDVRLAANGAEDAYTTTTADTSNNAKWKITASPTTDHYYIDCVGGGSKPRIRTDASTFADMQATSSAGNYTRWELTLLSNDYYLLTTEYQSNFARLRVNSSGLVETVTTSSVGNWAQFKFIEVSSSNKLAPKTRSIEPDNTISFYPVPTFDFINVELSTLVNAKLEIYNMVGQLVFSEKLNKNENRIDISNISAGSYISKIYNDGEVFTKKIIKK